jgi:hypothetical protein
VRQGQDIKAVNRELGERFGYTIKKSAHGICEGASIFLAQQLLLAQPKDEKALVQLIAKYTKGFPKEAVVAQHIRGLCRQVLNLPGSVHKSFSANVLNTSLVYLNKDGEKDMESVEIPSLDLSKQEDQIAFNSRQNGYYPVLFHTGKSNGHAVLFIKQDFGSYLIDPNFGMFKCQKDNNATSFYRWLAKNYKYFGKQPMISSFEIKIK